MNFKTILHKKCPKCNSGNVFNGLLTMNESCPVCGLSFFPEHGFYLGAMIVSYMITAGIGLPLMWIIFGKLESVMTTIGIAFVLFSLLSIPIYKYSRLIYLHFDFYVDPR